MFEFQKRVHDRLFLTRLFKTWSSHRHPVIPRRNCDFADCSLLPVYYEASYEGDSPERECLVAFEKILNEITKIDADPFGDFCVRDDEVLFFQCDKDEGSQGGPIRAMKTFTPVSEKEAATKKTYFRAVRKSNGNVCAHQIVRSVEYSFFYRYSERRDLLEVITTDSDGHSRRQPLQ